MKSTSILSVVTFLLMCLKQYNCIAVELSVVVEAMSRECFIQYFHKGLTVEVDFQVISGGDGLDLNFWVNSPKNIVVSHLQRQQSARPTFTTAEEGEYRICFDNSFSRFSAKQVHFYIGTTEEFNDPNFSPKPVFGPQSQLSSDELGELDNKLDNFRASFSKVALSLERSQRLQNLFKVYEAIDRSLMEQSYDRVNLFSTVNVVIMLVVACIQVFMIRSLFEDNSKVGRLLRGQSDSKRSFT